MQLHPLILCQPCYREGTHQAPVKQPDQWVPYLDFLFSAHLISLKSVGLIESMAGGNEIKLKSDNLVLT
jgi:hypothetical protein